MAMCGDGFRIKAICNTLGLPYMTDYVEELVWDNIKNGVEDWQIQEPLPSNF